VGDIKVADKTQLKNQSNTIRILVVGDVGSGKSSFIKTLLRFCGNERESKFVKTGEGSTGASDTVTMRHHRLTDTATTNYFICDMPGFPETTLNQDISMMTSHMKRYVDGYIHNGETVSYLFSLTDWFFSKRYADSMMDAVIFIARPPLDGKYRMNDRRLVHLKKMRQELEKTLGSRPFFFIIMATDYIEMAKEDTAQDILQVFEGSIFIVGKEEEGRCMPSVEVYTELMKGVFGIRSSACV
ncbi:hypothetical protein BC938DRAFT_477796, partial [Jimgerdemannia flammicorona]